LSIGQAGYGVGFPPSHQTGYLRGIKRRRADRPLGRHSQPSVWKPAVTCAVKTVAAIEDFPIAAD
jgi:hypothetical protein